MNAGAVGQIIGVRLDGVNHVFRIAALFQNLGALQRMVRRVGPALVIEVVQQADNAPCLRVFAEFARIGAHGGFDSKHVLDQARVFCVFLQEGEGVGTIHESLLGGPTYRAGGRVKALPHLAIRSDRLVCRPKHRR